MGGGGGGGWENFFFVSADQNRNVYLESHTKIDYFQISKNYKQQVSMKEKNMTHPFKLIS